MVFCGGLDSPIDISVMRDPGFSRETVDERHLLISLLPWVNLIRPDEMPVLLTTLGSIPRRGVLVETISLLT